MFTCPVCYYDQLDEPPMDYNICDCCGTEFGSDDEVRSHAELRDHWISNGAPWFFGYPKVGWNPWRQLFEANVANVAPYQVIPTFEGGVVSKISRRYTEDEYFALAS